ncbi:RNA-guided endonuclease InsQ/TnpB family protein [Rhodovibrio salinarum]|uniref:Transposase n=1 Tax=Rhodovibrio salinarum TaxID=1087 RepID=A0A934QGS4_9PROT|nr:RNA-guided endonuclease TnpB family protein [Rhodovibrio salinarum]MBK1696240.1 transposase [Rhodovibrio salinarum]
MPTFQLTHKIALDPTNKQHTLLARSAGTARFAYNWVLDEWKRQYRNGEKPTEAALRRQLNAVKGTDYPWMFEVSKSVPQQAVKDLGEAFKRFFQGKNAYPRFKKKFVDDSFRADNGPGTFDVQGKRIRLPRIGWIKTREPLRFSGRLKRVVVSRTADRWYASVLVEMDTETPDRENQAIGGVDLGVKALATLPDGTTFESPKALERNLKKLRRLSKAHSRKKNGSKNKRKSAAKLARLHRRIANIRADALHKLTSELVGRYDVIGIEDLNVSGMSQNKRLARHIADVGLHEFRRQLEYKAELYGTRIVVADRFYASSKTCSACGSKNEMLRLGDRAWTCCSCGTSHERDANAAANLQHIAASSAVTARGEESHGRGARAPVNLASTKREPGGKPAHATA